MMPETIDTRNKDTISSREELDRSVLHSPSLIACIYYALVLLAVGVPAWYYTCSLTRHPLPNIESLLKLTNKSTTNDSKLEISLHISLITFELENDVLNSALLRDSLPTSETNPLGYKLNLIWRVRRPMEIENQILEDASKQSNPVHTLEKGLDLVHSRNSRGRVWIYVLPERYHNEICRKTHSYIMSFERFIFVCPNFMLISKENHQPIVRMAMGAIRHIYVDAIDTTRMTHLLDAELDIVISLISERQPTLADLESLNNRSKLVHEVFNKNVREMFTELSQAINLRPVTQNVFEAYEPGQLEKCLTNSSGIETIRLFDIQKSRDLINTIRARISETQAKQIYHVFLLLPDPNRQPIVFHDPKSIGLERQNLLVSSDLNAIILWNNEKDFILAFRGLIRHILALRHNLPAEQPPTRATFFTRWEIDALISALTVAKIEKSSGSLNSITKLIDEVSNIVIEKEISSKMSDAFKLSLRASQMLSDGNLSDAYRSSAKAYELSESAFFDASLLKLLYFPHEQKYAIYLPLVFPLLFPLLASFNRLRAAFVAHRRRARNQ